MEKQESTLAGIPGREGKYLTFSLAGEEYGIGILKVKEIIGMMAVTHVPQTPGFVKGVINLRGKVIPVVDLRLRFGLEAAAYTERTCIIVVEVAGAIGPVMMGIVVDAVSEVAQHPGGRHREHARLRGAAQYGFHPGNGQGGRRDQDPARHRQGAQQRGPRRDPSHGLRINTIAKRIEVQDEESVSVNEDHRSVVTAVFTVGACLFASTYYFVDKGFQDQTQQEIARQADAVQLHFDSITARMSAAAKLTASRQGPCRGNREGRYGLRPETGQGGHARLAGRVHHDCRQERQRGGPRPLGQGGRQRPEPAQREESPGGRGLHGDRGRDRGEVFPEGGRPGEDRRQGRGLRHDGRRSHPGRSCRSRRGQEAVRHRVHPFPGRHARDDDAHEGRPAGHRHEDGQPEGPRHGPRQRTALPGHQQDPREGIHHGLLAPEGCTRGRSSACSSSARTGRSRLPR